MRRSRVRVPLNLLLIAGSTLVALAVSSSEPNLAATLLVPPDPQVQGRTAPASPDGTPALRYTGAQAEARIRVAQYRLDTVPGEVIVRFKPGTLRGSAQRVLNTLRSRPLLDDVEWVGDAMLVRDEMLTDGRLMAQALMEQPEVEYAEPNHVHHLPRGEKTGFSRPLTVGNSRTQATANDPAFASRQWNFPDIDLLRAWDINPGGSTDLIFASIDTGVTTETRNFTFPLWTGTSIQNFSIPAAISPDIASSRFVSPRDFVLFAAGTPVIDMDGHGTHTASTVAEETNNNVSLAGIAYKVKIMPLKVCSSYWDLQIIRSSSGQTGFVPLGSGFCDSAASQAALRYAADNGAKVINYSIGGTAPNNATRDAINYAVGKGVFVSISNGNDFEDGNPTMYPASFAASINGAMAVGATGRSRTRAYYSSTGTYTEIAAPGGSTRDGASGSGLIYQVSVNQSDVSDSLIVPRFDRYVELGLQGTSMAAPHVAGIAALIMSQVPGISPADVEAIIRSEALDLGAAGRDNDFGFGLIQPRKLLFGRGIRK